MSSDSPSPPPPTTAVSHSPLPHPPLDTYFCHLFGPPKHSPSNAQPHLRAAVNAESSQDDCYSPDWLHRIGQIHLTARQKQGTVRLHFGARLDPADWSGQPCFQAIDIGWSNVYFAVYALLFLALSAVVGLGLYRKRQRRRVVKAPEPTIVEENLEDGSWLELQTEEVTVTEEMAVTTGEDEDGATRRAVRSVLLVEYGLICIQTLGVLFAFLKANKVVRTKWLNQLFLVRLPYCVLSRVD